MQEKKQINTEISERILQVIEFLSISPNKFTKDLGYSRTQTIYDILNCKSAPSFEFFNRLFNSEYSAIINPIWLLTGKGAMTDKLDTVKTESVVIKNCKLCAEKDQTILALKEVNTVLRDGMELYKSRCKDPEQRIDDNQGSSESVQ